MHPNHGLDWFCSSALPFWPGCLHQPGAVLATWSFLRCIRFPHQFAFSPWSFLTQRLSCRSNLNTVESQIFFLLQYHGGRGLSFTGGEGRRLNLDIVDESKSHVASESETRQSHFFILKTNSCSEMSRLNHFLPAQKFWEYTHTRTHTHAHLHKHMVRRTKKRSKEKNNSLMTSLASLEHSSVSHIT